MDKIFKALRRLLADLRRPQPIDALAGLSIRDFADLPAYHPETDR